MPFMEALAAGVLPFAMTDEKFDWPNSTFRAQRLPLEHLGLAGKDLTSTGRLLEGARVG